MKEVGKINGKYNGRNRLVNILLSDVGYYYLHPINTKSQYSIDSIRDTDGPYLLYKHWETRRTLMVREADLLDLLGAIDKSYRGKRQIKDLEYEIDLKRSIQKV